MNHKKTFMKSTFAKILRRYKKTVLILMLVLSPSFAFAWGAPCTYDWLWGTPSDGQTLSAYYVDSGTWSVKTCSERPICDGSSGLSKLTVKINGENVGEATACYSQGSIGSALLAKYYISPVVPGKNIKIAIDTQLGTKQAFFIIIPTMMIF